MTTHAELGGDRLAGPALPPAGPNPSHHRLLCRPAQTVRPRRAVLGRGLAFRGPARFLLAQGLDAEHRDTQFGSITRRQAGILLWTLIRSSGNLKLRNFGFGPGPRGEPLESFPLAVAGIRVLVWAKRRLRRMYSSPARYLTTLWTANARGTHPDANASIVAGPAGRVPPWQGNGRSGIPETAPVGDVAAPEGPH